MLLCRYITIGSKIKFYFKIHNLHNVAKPSIENLLHRCRVQKFLLKRDFNIIQILGLKIQLK